MTAADILMFASAALVLLSVSIWWRSRRRQSQTVAPAILPASPLMTALARVIPARQSTVERIHREILQAGCFRNAAADEFLGTRNAALMLLALAVCGVAAADLFPARSNVIRLFAGGLVGGILVFAVPGLVLSLVASARKRRIQAALPDALDMLSMMLTGGLGIDRALQLTAERLAAVHPDLATEFCVISRQADVGSFSVAVNEFAERMDDPDMTALSSLIDHSGRLGTPLADSLVRFADDLRQNRRQRAEEIGNKRTVQLLFPVILFLAPPIYVLLLGPAALELRDFLRREKPAIRSAATAEPGALR